MLRIAAFWGLQPSQKRKVIALAKRVCVMTTMYRRGYPSWDTTRCFSSRSLSRSKQCCRSRGVRRWVLLRGKGRSHRRWYSGWWSWFVKEGARGVTRKHVACAAAVFMWDNDRITHQDVYRCLCQYERRVGRKCFTQTEEVPVVESCPDQEEGQPLEEGTGDRHVSSLCSEPAAAPSAESANANPSILPGSNEDEVRLIGPSDEETMEATGVTISKEFSVMNDIKKTLVSQSTSQPENTDTGLRLHQPNQSLLDSNPEKVKDVQGYEGSSKSLVSTQSSAALVSLSTTPCQQHSVESQEQVLKINTPTTPAQHSPKNKKQVSEFNSSIACAESQETMPDSGSSVGTVDIPSQHSSTEGHEQVHVSETTSLAPHVVTLAQHPTDSQEPIIDSSSSMPGVVTDGATTTDREATQENTSDRKPSIDRVALSAITKEKDKEESLGDPLEGWTQIVQMPNCLVYQKLYKDTGLLQYKVIGSYDDITARDFIDVQAKNEERKEWDTYALKLETVDRDPLTGSEVVHWVLKYPYPLANREYVFVRRVWFSDTDDAIVLINRSVDHPSVPTHWRQVRIKTYFSEMVIKPFTCIDQMGFDFELTYFDDPGTYLPSSAMNWVTRSAMPDFMSKIHTAALRKKKVQCINQLHKNMA